MNNNSKLILAIFVIFCITGCNSGGEPTDVTQNEIMKTPITHSLKQASIGSITSLGEPADVASNYQLQNTITALNSGKVRVALGNQTTNTNTYVLGSENSNSSNFFASAKVGGGFGLFQASLSTEYANKALSNSTGVTLITQGFSHFTVNTSIKSEDYLTPAAKKILIDKGVQAFQSKYGTGYISSLTLGTQFTVLYNISSLDQQTDQSLAIAANASYGNFAQFATMMKMGSASSSQNVSITLKIIIDGVPAEIPDNFLPVCKLNDLQTCETNITNTVTKYMNNNLSKLDDLKNKFGDQKQQTLTTFFDVFGSTGIADNNIFGLNKITYESYPNMVSVTDPKLINLQRNIIGNISSSAMLAGDSSLMQLLQGNSVVNKMITQNPDVKKIVDLSSQFSDLNTVLTSSNTIKGILSGCFSGGSFSSCQKYLKNTKLYYNNGANSIAINDYFNQLSATESTGLFNVVGYYSDVSKWTSNFFWIKFKNAESKDLLAPLNLNNLAVNQCSLSATNSAFDWTGYYKKGSKSLTGVKIYSYRQPENDSMYNIVDRWEFLPSDLTLQPTYDKYGRITSVRRSSPSMNEVYIESDNKKINYNGVIKCHIQDTWDPVTGKNRYMSVCDDPFGRANGLTFYTGDKSVNQDNPVDTLKNAISYYNAKAPISSSIHLADKNNSCKDTGSRTLNPQQPWCSSDGASCLQVDPSNNNLIIYKSFTKTTQIVGTLPDQNVFLSPDLGPGFWYNDPIHNGKTTTVDITGLNLDLIGGNSYKNSNGVEIFNGELTKFTSLAEQYKLPLGGYTNDCIVKSYTDDEHGTLNAVCNGNNIFFNYKDNCYVNTTSESMENSSSLWYINNNLVCTVAKGQQDTVAKIELIPGESLIGGGVSWPLINPIGNATIQYSIRPYSDTTSRNDFEYLLRYPNGQFPNHGYIWLWQGYVYADVQNYDGFRSILTRTDKGLELINPKSFNYFYFNGAVQFRINYMQCKPNAKLKLVVEKLQGNINSNPTTASPIIVNVECSD